MGEINKTITISFELSDETLARLEFMFKNRTADSFDIDKTLKKLAEASLNEYLDMITGERFFSRINDLKEYRLFLLIKNLYEGKIPDDAKISALFHVSSASSFVNSMTAKYKFEMDQILKDKIKDVLKAKETVNDENEISIDSKTIADEINRILMNIDGRLPKITKKMGTSSIYSIKNSSLEKLEKYLNQ